MANDIEEIKQRIDIVDLVKEYVPLKKAGSNWKARCPFHNEKSPSFMVSAEKQIYHCFGCDRGGDMFAFVQEMDGVEFPEALRLLATRAGVTLQQYDAGKSNRKTQLLDIIQKAQQFYASNLKQSPAAAGAREYVTKRGITDATQEDFGLGYSNDAWDTLLTFLQQQGYKIEDIFAAGLILKKDGATSYYDRFRGRFMIPLYDVNGQAVGFTARTLKADEEGGKYINSPQSDIYDKSQMLYGLYKAKQYIKKLRATIIVEGNVDVISAHQAGFRNVVASSGTALTDKQVSTLKRYSENLLFAFDTDAAGIKAAQRGIDIALQEGLNVKVMLVPEPYKDPDECIQQDPEAFKEAIRTAVHVIDFFFLSITRDLDLSRVEHKKKAVQELLPVLAKIADTVERSHYVQQLADLVRVDAVIIQKKLDQLIGLQKQHQAAVRKNVTQKPQQIQQKTQESPAANRIDQLSEDTIALILQVPEQFAYCANYLAEEFITDLAQQELYKRMLSYYNSTGQFDESGYVEQQPTDKRMVDVLHILCEDHYPEFDRQQFQEQLIRNIRTLHKAYVQRRLRQLEFELKAVERSGDIDTAEQLMKEFTLLTQQLTELSI